MIHDHQIAVPGERVRKCDGAAVNAQRGRSFGCGDVDPVRHPAAVSSRDAVTLADGSGHRPVEVVAERPQRQGRGRRGGGAAGQPAKAGLKILLRTHQLARQLGGEIALPVDAHDERVSILHGPIRRGLRSFGPGAQRRQAAGLFVERCSRGGQRIESPLVRGESVAIAPGQRCHHSRRLPETMRVGNGEHHPEVTPLPELVQLDEPRVQRRQFRLLLSLEPPDFVVEGRERGRCGRGVRVDLPELFRPDLPFQLGAPQIAKQRPFFRGETVGFGVQRLQALLSAGGKGLSTCAIRLPGDQRDRQHHEQKGGDRFHRCFAAGNYNIPIVRILGLDVGRRRIGLAISDPTGTLARPLSVLAVGDADGVDRVAREIERLAAEEDGLSALVVGVPARLDGSPTGETAFVTQFIAALKSRTTLSVVGADERLTSREAESRLAVRERDWRKRKAQLDAEAAAIILQDYLDRAAPKTDR